MWGEGIYCVCIADGIRLRYEVNDASKCQSLEVELRTRYDNVTCSPAFPA